MPTSSTSGVIKKRKPPTFQHLPLDRAKKLKRSWVETQKIKSQWKAQKRKDGLITRKPVSDMVVEENFDEEDKEDGTDVDNKSRMSSQDESSSEEEAEEKDDKVESADESESESEEEAPNAVRTSRVGSSRGRGRGGRGQGRPTELPYKRRRDADEDKEEPTLRELNRLAYSRSSLHTVMENEEAVGVELQVKEVVVVVEKEEEMVEAEDSRICDYG
ncbi:hypothetical protein C8Q75DRAFT_729136 [Abortiporus biennis]|nr:hypothetical protein C8Q75DRAFT_729136 [Abortiporus biennis]